MSLAICSHDVSIPNSYLKLINNCVDLCVCVCTLSDLLCDCCGAEGGQARALIGGHSLCNLCQITTITRLRLLSALMTSLHEKLGSSRKTHGRMSTHTFQLTHSEVRQIGQGNEGLRTGREAPPADGRRLRQTGDACTQANVYTFT